MSNAPAFLPTGITPPGAPPTLPWPDGSPQPTKMASASPGAGTPISCTTASRCPRLVFPLGLGCSPMVQTRPPPHPVTPACASQGSYSLVLNYNHVTVTLGTQGGQAAGQREAGSWVFFPLPSFLWLCTSLVLYEFVSSSGGRPGDSPVTDPFPPWVKSKGDTFFLGAPLPVKQACTCDQTWPVSPLV